MTWDEILNSSNRTGLKTYQVFQEEIQKAILASLSHEGIFNDIVFQGGTALRLFYGNPRFSEDLDFVIRKGRSIFDLTGKISKIQTFVRDVFPFLEEIKINVQKNNRDMQRIIFRTISDISEQKLRIHIKLAYVPSYYNQPKILDYPPLNPAVRIENTFEILADKMTALGNRPYLKGRDIWDIYFLTVEKQISVPWNLVIQKAKDYGSTPTAVKEKILNASKRLNDEGVLILSSEMKRFLPKPILDQYREVFDEIVTKVAREAEKVKTVDVEKEYSKGEKQ